MYPTCSHILFIKIGTRSTYSYIQGHSFNLIFDIIFILCTSKVKNLYLNQKKMLKKQIYCHWMNRNANGIEWDQMKMEETLKNCTDEYRHNDNTGHYDIIDDASKWETVHQKTRTAMWNKENEETKNEGMARQI
ncbi:hypothetical protein QE152_g38065 [Popillia japonica]|uniref:Uncharacterized protein n=1 Tax=Popillia japonica TaxID=7064 RepID=A0AAW1I8Y8_POPJA